MAGSPPAALLRLREADVVRLCGLAAAARALDLVRERALGACRRDGLRLETTVRLNEQAVALPWVEMPADDDRHGARWGCSCPAGQAYQAAERDGGAPQALACEHVAALLTTWIRAPAEFKPATPEISAPAHPHPAQRPARDVAAGGSAAPGLGSRSPSAGGTSARERLTLAEALSRMPDARLRAIAEHVLGSQSPLPQSPLPLEREGLIDAMVRVLSDAAQVATAVGKLDAGARTLLRAVVLLGGAVTATELRGVAERSELSQRTRATALTALRLHGLLFRARVGVSGGVTGWRVAPESYSPLLHALGLGLVPYAPSSTNSRARTSDTPAKDGATTASQIRPAPLRQLCAALALLPLSPGPINPDAATVGARHASAPGAARDGRASILLTAPGDPDQRALTSWARGALVSPGLARMARRVLRAAMEDEAVGHLLLGLSRLPPQEWPLALRAGFRVWRAAATWAELADLATGSSGVQARFDPGQPTFQPGTLAGENAAGRRFVVELLSHAPPASWLGLDDFVELVWRLNPLFLRGRQRAFGAPAWWLEDSATGRPLRPDARGEWLRAEGRYVRALLLGPLHWWGALDVAMLSSGVPAAIRVTPFGAYLLGSADAAPDLASLAVGWGAAVMPVRGHALAVQPMAAGIELLDALHLWTRIARIQAGRAIVQLDRDLICEHFDAGRDAEPLLAQLLRCDARDGTSAAPTLEAALAELRTQYGGARIERALAMVEGADEATLREALALVPGLGARCRWLAPEMVAIPASCAEELRAALVRRGFTI